MKENEALDISSKFLEWKEYMRCKQERAYSARNLGLKECQKCGCCCSGVTCLPKPDEIELIAKFLGLTGTELVKRYMVIDKFDDTNQFLRFAKEGQEDITGKSFPEERRFDRGYCILFDRKTKACKIYPVRPLEARDLNCWDAEPKFSDGAGAWGKDDIYEFVPSFRSCDQVK